MLDDHFCGGRLRRWSAGRVRVSRLLGQTLSVVAVFVFGGFQMGIESNHPVLIWRFDDLIWDPCSVMPR